MRMSCNGCRVLRKGCSENCSIRPCLQWIKSPDSQAHATVFLAKFYGRAGLMNLITSGPDHLRPAIFRSLLYEACGRIVNPISGSVGLLWSGSWHLCQNAVEAVLRGAPITQIASDVAESSHGPPLKAYDIRHVSRDENSAGSNDLRKVRTRCRFKRSVAKPKASRVGVGSGDELVKGLNLKWRRCYPDELTRSTSHESSVSHVEGERRETTDSMVSDETAEEASALTLNRAELESVQPKPENEVEDGEVGLELALGFKPYSCSHNVGPMKKERSEELCGSLDDGTCKVELGLYHPE